MRKIRVCRDSRIRGKYNTSLVICYGSDRIRIGPTAVYQVFTKVKCIERPGRILVITTNWVRLFIADVCCILLTISGIFVVVSVNILLG